MISWLFVVVVIDVFIVVLVFIAALAIVFRRNEKKNLKFQEKAAE